MKKFNNNDEFDKFIRVELYNLEKEPPMSVFKKLDHSIQSYSHKGINKNWYWLGGISLAIVALVFIINPFKSTNDIPAVAKNVLAYQPVISNNDVAPVKQVNEVHHAINKKSDKITSDISTNKQLVASEPEHQNLETTTVKSQTENKTNSLQNTNNQIKTNYQILVKAASCRKSNGKVHIKSNIEGMRYYWVDLALYQESANNIKGGKYTVYSKNKDLIIDTLLISVPDSGSTLADFKIYDIALGNEMITIFENNSRFEKENWKQCKDCSFHWNFGDGSYSNLAEPQHSYSNSNTYFVTLVTASKYGCKDSLTKSYVITIPQNFAEVPNVFTPNNDGINETFQPTVYDMQSLECSIFNRNGELVYEWKDINGSWNGKIRNTDQLAAPGTYYYVLRGITKSGKNVVQKGMVQLSL